MKQQHHEDIGVFKSGEVLGRETLLEIVAVYDMASNRTGFGGKFCLELHQLEGHPYFSDDIVAAGAQYSVEVLRKVFGDPPVSLRPLLVELRVPDYGVSEIVYEASVTRVIEVHC